jgi:hypothetical protein
MIEDYDDGIITLFTTHTDHSKLNHCLSKRIYLMSENAVVNAGYGNDAIGST